MKEDTSNKTLHDAVAKAYDDAIQAAVNPFLYEEGDGPLDLQRKIKQAIEFRKKLALRALSLPKSFSY